MPKKKAPSPPPGRARKDVLMIVARKVAATGSYMGARSVIEAVIAKEADAAALKIWATPADKFELDQICERARRDLKAKLRKEERGR